MSVGTAEDTDYSDARGGRRTVLVTGASSGVGRAIATTLAAEGHLIYATARRNADLDELRSIENVVPLRLDVTHAQDIAAAVSMVESAGCGLYGLVNNAGVGTLGSIEESEDGEFELAMAVNALGPYRLTRALIPLIRRGRGRIIMISSIAGIVTEANLGAYCMSKHAIEAFADVLALEMEPCGVQVSIVEPGGYNTPLVENAVRRIGASLPWPDLSTCRPPDDVARAVSLALFEPRPSRRYLVTATEAEANKTISKQIERLVQLNQRQPHAYKRDALVTMLDEAIGRIHG